MRVSTGTNLWFTSRGEEEIDLNALAEEWAHELAPITTPIIAGEEMRTYVMRPRLPIPATSLRHILIRPTDVADSRFEIESIRIIRRHEHLARIRSGVSWQGLAEIYRETLVTRSPEVARFTFAVPDGGWLDLAVGTIEKNPVIFQVDLLSPGGDEPGQRLMTRTLTRPDRWGAQRFVAFGPLWDSLCATSRTRSDFVPSQMMSSCCEIVRAALAKAVTQR